MQKYNPVILENARLTVGYSQITKTKSQGPSVHVLKVLKTNWLLILEQAGRFTVRSQYVSGGLHCYLTDICHMVSCAILREHKGKGQDNLNGL